MSICSDSDERVPKPGIHTHGDCYRKPKQDPKTHNTIYPQSVVSKSKKVNTAIKPATQIAINYKTMIPITRANLYSFCRLCLQQITAQGPHHSVTKRNLFELLEMIAGACFQDNNLRHYPKRICHVCYIKVNAVNTFREKAILATAVLRMVVAEDLQKAALVKLKTLCRVCFAESVANSKQSYDLEANQEDINAMCKCTGLDWDAKSLDCKGDEAILASDQRFPKHLCSKCYGKLVNFIELRSVTKYTEDFLSNLLDGIDDYDRMSHSTVAQPKQEIIIEQLPILDNLDEETTESQILASNSDNFKQRNESTQLDRRNSTRLEHEKRHYRSSQRPFQCVKCKKVFTKQINYETHKKRVHEKVEKPFICQYCPSAYRLFRFLHNHINLMHTSKTMQTTPESIALTPRLESLHVCLICNKRFQQKNMLSEHMTTAHEGSCRFHCRICKKAFSSEETRLHHEQNHNITRPFGCEQCSKRFNAITDLKKHEQRHVIAT